MRHGAFVGFFRSDIFFHNAWSNYNLTALRGHLSIQFYINLIGVFSRSRYGCHKFRPIWFAICRRGYEASRFSFFPARGPIKRADFPYEPHIVCPPRA